MAKQAVGRALVRLGNALMDISAAPGRWSAWLVLVLVLVAVFGVIGAQLQVNVLATWETRLPLLGQRLSMTGLSELQWHLLSVIIMLAGAYALRQDTHIRVDLFSSRFSPRTRQIIDTLGDLFLLLPFFALLMWFSFKSTQTAFNFGEQSNSGGLVDRYLVKAILPIGCGLLLLAGTGRILRNVGLLLWPEGADPLSKETA